MKLNDTIMEAKGHNGQLELTNSVVSIKRRGALAVLSHGRSEKNSDFTNLRNSIQECLHLDK